MTDISGAFEVDGLIKTKKELEALLSSNPEMEKIAPRNFFANSSHKALQQAAEQLDQLINELIAKEFGKE